MLVRKSRSNILKNNPEFDKEIERYIRNQTTITQIAKLFDVSKQWVHEFLTYKYERDVFAEKEIKTQQVLEMVFLERNFNRKELFAYYFVEKYPDHFSSEQIFWRMEREGELNRSFREEEYYNLTIEPDELKEQFDAYLEKELVENGYENLFVENSYELKYDALRQFSKMVREDMLRLTVYTMHVYQASIPRIVIDKAKELGVHDSDWTTAEEPERLELEKHYVEH